MATRINLRWLKWIPYCKFKCQLLWWVPDCRNLTKFTSSRKKVTKIDASGAKKHDRLLDFSGARPTDSGGQRVGSTHVSLTFSLSARVSLTVIFWKISVRFCVGKRLNWPCLVSCLSSLLSHAKLVSQLSTVLCHFHFLRELMYLHKCESHKHLFRVNIYFVPDYTLWSKSVF